MIPKLLNSELITTKCFSTETFVRELKHVVVKFKNILFINKKSQILNK